MTPRNAIKEAISGFYTFGQLENAFPEIHARFIFEERALKVIFPVEVAVAGTDRAEHFIRLISYIAGLLKVPGYGTVGDMRQLFYLAADRKNLSPGQNMAPPHLSLTLVGSDLVEIKFESDEL